MRVAVFSCKPYDHDFISEANRRTAFELTFFEPRLSRETVVLAHGHDVVCAFVNDDLSGPILSELATHGVRLIAMRCAGTNNVDLAAAKQLGLRVVRVPAYSPHAVAEHALALALAMNRHIPQAYHRVRDGNFALNGLLGFDFVDKTVGVAGTGRIGAVAAKLFAGLGCRVLAFDPMPSRDCVAEYVTFDRLIDESDVLTLHMPLTPETRHLIDVESIARMKRGVMLINTSRGGLIDTQAAIDGLKSGQIGYLGLDVYEEESELFFEDLSSSVIHDDVFARLLTFPNVLITGHQAFFTREALTQIAETTIHGIEAFARSEPLANAVV